MAKKAQHKKKPFASKQGLVNSQQLLDYLSQLQFDLLKGKFDSVLHISQLLMNFLPSSSPHLPEVLLKRGTALMELAKYTEAYDVLNRAAELAPNDGLLLYIYSQACLYTNRLGKAAANLEKATTLEPILLEDRAAKKRLKDIRKEVQRAIKLRGNDYTLEQLIEQEELEIAATYLLMERKIEEAEAAFRQVIAMGDAQPAPHNNLASCLIQQGKFKEAEQELLRSLKLDRFNKVALMNLPVVRHAIKTGEGPEFIGTYYPGEGLKDIKEYK